MTRGAAPLLALAALAALAPAGTASAQLLRSPVTCPNCISDWYYVDQGFGGDWNCGSSSYSDHTGSDYSLRNGNFAIDDDNEVVAMAAGTVVHAEDGYYDRCTQCGGLNCGTDMGNGFANQVIVNHGAYRTIYGHMKQGSIAVQPGDTVTCGQVLGFIGSSGCSTGAHLHIEPSLAANFGVGRYEYIDPYEGDCSPTEASLWSDQGSYRAMPGSTCDDTLVCPADTFEIWTCTMDDGARRRCRQGMVEEETCGFGCTVMPTGTDDECALPPDADGDGSRADVDCDDANASRHPGAVDTCGDGIDQACSGMDMACPVPTVPSPSTAGTSAPPITAGSAAPSAAGAGAPVAPAPWGTAGQAAPTFGQAGSGALVPAPLPTLAPRASAEEAGCRASPVGAAHGGPSALPALAIIVWLASRRLPRRRAPA